MNRMLAALLAAAVLGAGVGVGGWFVGEGFKKGRATARFVTGKGLSRPDGGVLRQAVPRWLNKPPNRQRVLSFSYAQPRDGGMGALYILLRRRRDD